MPKTIIIDAMGGDNAPREILCGVRSAIEDTDARFLLVGRQAEVEPLARDLGLGSERVELVHAPSVVDMADDPLTAYNQKKDSSMMLGLRLLAEGRGDAFVSAGNTGALFTGATFIVKRAKGVKRAAIGTMIPGDKPFLLLDAGANVSVTPAYLEQFAIMGAEYMKHLYGLERPAVGLLNNGTEDGKGTPLQTETHARLKACKSICYVGNVEGNRALLGGCDVLVADGFTGNIFLKTAEGAFRLMLGTLKQEYRRNTVNKLSALLFRKSLMRMKDTFDPSEHGGSPILGISKPVIKAHGSSDARAIRNAILRAVGYAQSGMADTLSEVLTEENPG